MAPVSFVYFTLGDSLVHYLQCQYSILSLLRFRDQLDLRVVAVTDNPASYAWLGEAIEVVEVDAERVREWRGPTDFFWRTKIMAMRTVFAAHPRAHLVYLDGDTFVRRSPAALVRRLEQGRCLMHLREYNVAATIRRSVARQLWRLHGNQEYAGIACTADSDMWNAGLVGVGRDDGALIDSALDCLDAMEAAGRGDKYNEQFALSLVFAASGRLTAGDDVVDHYWGNKRRWSAAIARFLLQSRLANESPLAAADRLNSEEPALRPWQHDPWLWRKWLKKFPEYRLMESILR